MRPEVRPASKGTNLSQICKRAIFSRIALYRECNEIGRLSFHEKFSRLFCARLDKERADEPAVFRIEVMRSGLATIREPDIVSRFSKKRSLDRKLGRYQFDIQKMSSFNHSIEVFGRDRRFTGHT